MAFLRVTLLIVMILAWTGVRAQDSSTKPTSATDSGIKIEKVKRARGTTPPKQPQVRFTEKNKKKATNVREREPIVYKHSKRVEKRRVRQSAKAGKLTKKKRRTPLPSLE